MSSSTAYKPGYGAPWPEYKIKNDYKDAWFYFNRKMTPIMVKIDYYNQGGK